MFKKGMIKNMLFCSQYFDLQIIIKLVRFNCAAWLSSLKMKHCGLTRLNNFVKYFYLNLF